MTFRVLAQGDAKPGHVCIALPSHHVLVGLLCLHAVVNNFGRITWAWVRKGHNNGSLIRLWLYYTLPIATGIFSTQDALSHYPFQTYILKKSVIFTIRQKQLHRSCISGLYSILLHVSAVHISHHQVVKWLTKRVKGRGLSLQLVSVKLLTINYNNYSENLIIRDNKLIYGDLHRNPYCSQEDVSRISTVSHFMVRCV